MRVAKLRHLSITSEKRSAEPRHAKPNGSDDRADAQHHKNRAVEKSGARFDRGFDLTI
jgi:hypothetical protein